MLTPVTLPPGRAKECTKPEAAKSMDRATIGVAGAASCATRSLHH